MTDSRLESAENLENVSGGPGQAFLHFLKMEEIMDKLKVLNYDKEFVKALKMKPLHRHYFAIQTNPGEQFYLFTSLAGWLIRKCEKPFEQPQEYDDPNSTISSILDVIREFNVPINFPPNRLKQGFGEYAIFVLEHLVNEAMKHNNIKWLPPEPAVEVEKGDEEELEDEAELILEKVEEEMATFFSDDDEDNIINLDDLSNLQILKNFQENNSKNEEILESTVNSEEWLVELERVLPQLKITIKTDSRDWRAHLEQMQKYNQGIQENFSATKSQLDKLHNEIVSVMDKISTREKHLNSNLEPVLLEFRKKQEELNKLTEKFKIANDRVNEKSKSLTRIAEELENVKKEMEERGSSMTDGTPLINVKKAMSKLKSEIIEMNIRIGVLENEILQGRLRDKTLSQQDIEAPFSIL